MSRRVPSLALTAALSFCIAWWSETASAQWAVGVDAGLTKQSAHDVWGQFVDARFGTRFGLPRAFIIHTIICQPELIVGYRWLPWVEEKVWRFGGGGRIGILAFGLEAFVYGHVSGVDGNGDSGYLGDFGGAFDYRLPTWSLGYHYTRQFIHVNDLKGPFDEFGMHVEVRGFWF